VAANTEKIALGTAIVNLIFHNPVVLAKKFATLDILSKGRVVAAGFGLGSVKEEYQASNIPFANRGDRADEFIQVLKRIWTHVVEFKGKYYNIPPSKIGPKPIQKPHIPIYCGGESDKAFSRIVNYTDGWIAGIEPGNSGRFERLEHNIKRLKEEAKKANRDPDTYKVLQ
jgi:alkanesulfonate monooxygenase SsuD/methylene tetrahydromethanopterin reductase-like flavin-dependent oxidoreductase (luciferase family)